MSMSMRAGSRTVFPYKFVPLSPGKTPKLVKQDEHASAERDDEEPLRLHRSHREEVVDSGHVHENGGEPEFEGEAPEHQAISAQPEASCKAAVALREETSHLAADDPQEGDRCRLAGHMLKGREGIAEPPALYEVEREEPGEPKSGFHHPEEEECAEAECPRQEWS